jgi:SAM-dependent methyltransferase
VPLHDIPRPAGAPCPLRRGPAPQADRARTLYLRLPDRMRAFRTETTDFADAELLAVKEALGQVYVDVSKKLAPDDFARDLRKLRQRDECAACERRAACPGCWQAEREDVFSRDDAIVLAILARLSGRVLDLGGGEAAYVAALPAREIEYVCVDPDELRLAVVAARFPFARCVAARAEDIGGELGAFDHVLMLRSYNHLADPGRAVARAVARLRPGGTLLVVDNVAFGLVRTTAHAARAEGARENLLEHYRNDGAAEAAAVIAAAGPGLRLVERRDVGPGTSNQWLLRYERTGEA